MNILGLHFGHDAAAAVLVDGRVASCVVRERHSRVKHAMTLDMKTIDAALTASGVSLKQIDAVAITSTQTIELIIDAPQRLSIRVQANPPHAGRSTMVPVLARANIDPGSRLNRSLVECLQKKDQGSFLHQVFSLFYPEFRQLKQPPTECSGWLDEFCQPTSWTDQTLDQIAAGDFSAVLRSDELRMGFHYPVTTTIDGRELPGYFIHHHAAHAASVYTASGLTQAAIFTHDGFSSGVGTLSGLFFHAIGNRLFPITPHHLAVGTLYHMTGVFLGLGISAAPGKLMGLAGYGKPRFFERRFVGNWYDWEQRRLGVKAWIEHCVRQGHAMGYDLKALGDPTRMTDPINADIAASTQKLFEETCLDAAEALYKILERSGARTDALCLSGGTALNCPSNSRIAREGPFRRVFVEPGCDDSGLAMGAAMFLYHNVLDQPLPVRSPGVFASPYLGVPITPEQIDAALQAAGAAISYSRCDNAAETAAADLVANKVIGWFEGRSEIGPRALGHRSILADPRQAANWPRVNRIKGREPWRPFAPAVLQQEAGKWFMGSPLPSPCMLFTATIRSIRVPAVTHADQSARLQTVDESCGGFFHVVQKFFEKTGVPMVLNTSFNGPGQPIIETPGEALAFLCISTLDALYIGGYRVTQKLEAVYDPCHN